MVGGGQVEGGAPRLPCFTEEGDCAGDFIRAEKVQIEVSESLAIVSGYVWSEGGQVGGGQSSIYYHYYYYY